MSVSRSAWSACQVPKRPRLVRGCRAIKLTGLAENGVTTVAHAISDDRLFALLRRGLLISAGADQAGERADTRAQQRVAADRAEHRAAGAAGGGADAGAFGFLGVVAGGARRLL